MPQLFFGIVLDNMSGGQGGPRHSSLGPVGSGRRWGQIFLNPTVSHIVHMATLDKYWYSLDAWLKNAPRDHQPIEDYNQNQEFLTNSYDIDG